MQLQQVHADRERRDAAVDLQLLLGARPVGVQRHVQIGVLALVVNGSNAAFLLEGDAARNQALKCLIGAHSKIPRNGGSPHFR